MLVGSSIQVQTSTKYNNNVEKRISQKGKSIHKENLYAKPIPLKCYRCFQPGHKSNECPTSQHVQLLEAELENEQNSNSSENEEYEIEEITCDEGESLVRVMEKLFLAS